MLFPNFCLVWHLHTFVECKKQTSEQSTAILSDLSFIQQRQFNFFSMSYILFEANFRIETLITINLLMNARVFITFHTQIPFQERQTSDIENERPVYETQTSNIENETVNEEITFLILSINVNYVRQTSHYL